MYLLLPAAGSLRKGTPTLGARAQRGPVCLQAVIGVRDRNKGAGLSAGQCAVELTFKILQGFEP